MSIPNSIKIGHEILNHKFERITISQTILRELRKKNYLKRHRSTGLLQFKPDLIQLYREMEGGVHTTDLFYYLGKDLQGPNTVDCKCKGCRIVKMEQINLTDILNERYPIENDSSGFITTPP
jgi:hypothetical protein